MHWFLKHVGGHGRSAGSYESIEVLSSCHFLLIDASFVSVSFAYILMLIYLLTYLCCWKAWARNYEKQTKLASAKHTVFVRQIDLWQLGALERTDDSGDCTIQLNWNPSIHPCGWRQLASLFWWTLYNWKDCALLVFFCGADMIWNLMKPLYTTKSFWPCSSSMAFTFDNVKSCKLCNWNLLNESESHQ